MMDAYSLLNNFLHRLDSRQLPVLLIKHEERPAVDQFYPFLLCLSSKVIFDADGLGVRLHVLLAETKNYDWV